MQEEEKQEQEEPGVRGSRDVISEFCREPRGGGFSLNAKSWGSRLGGKMGADKEKLVMQERGEPPSEGGRGRAQDRTATAGRTRWAQGRLARVPAGGDT